MRPDVQPILLQQQAMLRLSSTTAAFFVLLVRVSPEDSDTSLQTKRGFNKSCQSNLPRVKGV
jgi:hypothetical protein